MIITAFIVGVLLIVTGIILESSINHDDTGSIIVWFGLAIAGISLLVGFFTIGNAVEGRYIDSKIAMYVEENKAIEEDVTSIVENYMDYEEQIFKVDNASLTTLIQMYPDLKTDTLIKEQIKVYVENNKQIKKLKEERFDCSKARWLLYFGE